MPITDTVSRTVIHNGTSCAVRVCVGAATGGKVVNVVEVAVVVAVLDVVAAAVVAVVVAVVATTRAREVVRGVATGRGAVVGAAVTGGAVGNTGGGGGGGWLVSCAHAPASAVDEDTAITERPRTADRYRNDAVEKATC